MYLYVYTYCAFIGVRVYIYYTYMRANIYVYTAVSAPPRITLNVRHVRGNIIGVCILYNRLPPTPIQCFFFSTTQDHIYYTCVLCVCVCIYAFFTFSFNEPHSPTPPKDLGLLLCIYLYFFPRRLSGFFSFVHIVWRGVRR